jgi:hypothetical protein
MKRFLPALLSVLLVSQSVQAEPIRSIPPGDDKIAPLKKGEDAPFDGQLFDTNTAIRWGNWLEQYRVRIELDKETQQLIHQAQINYLNQVIKIEQDQYKQVTDVQREKIQELEKKAAEGEPWYESFQTGMVVGALATVIVVGLSVGIVSATSK